MSSLAPSRTDWLYLMSIALIWGSSFFLIKKGLVVFLPEQVASMRIFFSMLALSPLLFSSWKKIPEGKLPYVLSVGFIGSGIPPFLFCIAQTQIDSATAGILNSLTPLFTLVLGALFFNSPFIWSKFTGVFLGLLGAVSLMVFDIIGGTGTGSNPWYGLFVLGASICYAISINIVKSHCQDVPPIALNVLAFAGIGPFAGVYLFQSGFITTLTSAPGAWEAFAYVLILAVIGTALATILFFRLAQSTDALFASTVTYLIPVVALLWGWYDGEAIGLHYLIGLAAILAGVYLAGRSK